MNRHRLYWSAMGDNRPYEEIERDIMECNRLYEQALKEVKSLIESPEMKTYICKKLIIDKNPDYAHVKIEHNVEYTLVFIDVLNIISRYFYNSHLVRYEGLRNYISSKLVEELTEDEEQ